MCIKVNPSGKIGLKREYYMAAYVILSVLILFFLAIFCIHIRLHIGVLYQNLNGQNLVKIIFTLDLFNRWKKESQINLDFDSWAFLADAVYKKKGSYLKDKEKDIDLILRQILRILAMKVQNQNVIKDNSALFYLFKSIVIDKLDWKSIIGHDDYMLTGILTGVIWIIKGILLSLLSHKISLLQTDLKVTPHYGNPVLESSLTCIAELKVVHIIIISLLALYLKIRGWMYGTKRAK